MEKKFIAKALTGYSEEPWLKNNNAGLNFCYKPNNKNNALEFLFDTKEEILKKIESFNYNIIVEIVEVYV